MRRFAGGWCSEDAPEPIATQQMSATAIAVDGATVYWIASDGIYKLDVAAPRADLCHDARVILPVGINHVIRGWPLVTLSIIAVCTLMHVYTVAIAPSPEEVGSRIRAIAYALPADADEAADQRAADEIEREANRLPAYRFGYHTDRPASLGLITSAFVHGGWLHLIGNMLFLWLAGAALEDRWGRARFSVFYVAGAIAATLGFAAVHTGEPTTLIGASGAISALMGAFLVYFARMQIYFVYLWIGGFGRFDLVAYVALPLWFGEQLFYGALYTNTGTSNVAFSAHIAGFVFGVVAALAVRVLFKSKTVDDAVVEQPPETPAPKAPEPVKVAPPTPSKPAAQPAPLARVKPPVNIEPPKVDGPVDPDAGPRFLK